MTNEELLKSAGLYQRNMQTGKTGFTLACILLFGKDETIRSALPHHRTDAILRRVNLDRYDDRDDIRCNLIESYDRLMNFIEKHLNDMFYLEGDIRVSVRNKLFREVIGNILIHREYSNAFPAKLIIGTDKVTTENGNKAHGHGMIDINDFIPFPKNPSIAGVFKEIGWADELGSGIRNIKHYARIYSKSEPVFIEGDVFKTIIKLKTDDKKPTIKTDDNKNAIVQFLKENTEGRNKDFAEILNLKSTRIKEIVHEMIADEILVAEGSNRNRIYKLKE